MMGTTPVNHIPNTEVATAPQDVATSIILGDYEAGTNRRPFTTENPECIGAIIVRMDHSKPVTYVEISRPAIAEVVLAENSLKVNANISALNLSDDVRVTDHVECGLRKMKYFASIDVTFKDVD